jgi:hypothetical protein
MHTFSNSLFRQILKIQSQLDFTLQILQDTRPILPNLIQPTLCDPTLLPWHSITFNFPIPNEPPDVVCLIMPSAACCGWVIEGFSLDFRIFRMGDDGKALGSVGWIYYQYLVNIGWITNFGWRYQPSRIGSDKSNQHVRLCSYPS